MQQVMIDTTKANGLEPYAYLKKVFTELPKASCIEDIGALLPFQLSLQQHKYHKID